MEAVKELLEERLVEHDNRRKEVQEKIKERGARALRGVDSLEGRISGEISGTFGKTEEEVSTLIDKLANGKWAGDKEMNSLMERAHEILSSEQKAEIQHPGSGKGFASSYKLEITSIKKEMNLGPTTTDDDEVVESIVSLLQEHFNRIQESRASVQDEIVEICAKRRKEIEGIGQRINSELEAPFTQEDARIQEVVKLVKEKIGSKDSEEVKALTRKARLTLLRNQRYTLEDADLYEDCGLRVEKEASLKSIDFEERKPKSLIPSFTEKGDLSLSFAFFDEDEAEVLKEVDSHFEVEVKVWEKGHEEDTSRILTKELTLGSGDEPICFKSTFTASTAYFLKMKIIHQGTRTQWSDEGEFTTPEFKCCVWKGCPGYVREDRKYSVDEKNPRITSKIDDGNYCTIIGNTPLPLNKVTPWSVKVLKSRENDGNGIYIGVAPLDIDQNEGSNSNKCGWYFYCYRSTLYSGHPHDYEDKEYGPRKEKGQYVNIGDIVGVVMDTAKGELSFALNGVNLGGAYEGIPLDKPFVPCALLWYENDSVELDTSEVKENVDSSIPVLSNVIAKNITWDSISLTWDAVEGASFYQIEVDGSKFWDASTTNAFTKRGLLPGSEHTFRVRAVRGSSVSEWSSAVKGRTKEKSFETSRWKECPVNFVEKIKYSVDEEDPRIATKNEDGYFCTIIGNTPIPLNTVTSWSFKILKSKNNGDCIFIGVAPSDINQNERENFKKRGWYFNCSYSKLWSGPPHNYRNKEYDPRKEDGQYVHNGDSVGVVMDTAKGELSFVLNGANLGVAYEGIPLDKPLVPCVLLWHGGDSVELDTSEVKENDVDSSIPVPSSITTKSTTWDSITLTWDGVVEGASFYQIEVDGSKSWDASTTSTFTKRGILAETEHAFKVRAVVGDSVSGWSDAVKGRTQKASDFSGCVWKECPDCVDESMKYSVDEENPRIATKNGEKGYCTIIGNTPLPPNTVTSWSIKILKSKMNNGGLICIGVVPSDINQNKDDNYYKCGWYFDCYYSTLWSGPPHNYEWKEYGPRKGGGEYVHTGDSVGVVMDTAKGELSFALNGVNLGVVYEGIPLDKPLVPCVVLGYKGDSVELVI